MPAGTRWHSWSAPPAYHFGWRTPGRWARSQGRCVELGALTESLYGAREEAVDRLEAAARELAAAGVIDTAVLERPAVWGRHVIEFVAYGTAIVWDSERTPLDAIVANVMLNDPGIDGSIGQRRHL